MARLLRIEEVQDVLGVGRTTVYRLLARGRLVRVKIGHRTLVTAESVDALIAESVVPPGVVAGGEGATDMDRATDVAEVG